MSSPGDSAPSAVELIGRGAFARLWWANSISSLGDWITLFATLELAGDIAGLGGTLIALIARVLPGLLFGAIAGVLADRWDRKLTMVLSDLSRALLVVLLPFVDNLTAIFIISFLMEIGSLVRQPAREASIPNLVPPGALVKANSLSLAGTYGTMPVGSLLLTLFGALVVYTGWTAQFDVKLALAFWLDSLTFLASAFIVLTIDIPQPEVPEERKARSRLDWRAPMRDIVDGIRFVVASQSIRGVIVGMTTALFGAGALFIIGDQFAQSLLGGGEAGFGLLLTSLGVGGGLGMVSMSALSNTLTKRAAVFGLSLVLGGLATLLAATTQTIWGASGWIFVGGFATGTAYVMGFTHIHEQVDDELRGRTFATLFTLARTALLVSLTVASAVAAGLDKRFPAPFDSGVRLTLVLGGLIVLVAGLGTVWSVRKEFPGSVLGEGVIRPLRERRRNGS